MEDTDRQRLVEGSLEKILEILEFLGLDWNDAILEDQRTIHKKYFGVDMDDFPEYVFED